MSNFLMECLIEAPLECPLLVKSASDKFCRLLRTTYPDQAHQNDWPDLDPNYMTL